MQQSISNAGNGTAEFFLPLRSTTDSSRNLTNGVPLRTVTFSFFPPFCNSYFLDLVIELRTNLCAAVGRANSLEINRFNYDGNPNVEPICVRHSALILILIVESYSCRNNCRRHVPMHLIFTASSIIQCGKLDE